MREKNIPIAFLEAKVKILLEVFSRSDKIAAATVRALADKILVPETTLKSQFANCSVSEQTQREICKLGGFLSSEESWRDPDQNSSVHARYQIVPNDYQGKDTPKYFRTMLEARLLNSTFYDAKPTTLIRHNEDLASHLVTATGQGATRDNPMPLFLELSFSPYFQNRIRYGFSKARLYVDVVCQHGSSARVRSVHLDPPVAGPFKLTAFGTSLNRHWDVESHEGQSMLTGILGTTEPLIDLIGFQPDTVIESRLSFDPYDGFLEQNGSDAEPISENQTAIIEMLCAMKLSDHQDANGRVQLSTQTLTITAMSR